MEITVFKREEEGTGASNQYRRNEQVPGVIYGKGEETTSILFDERDIENVLKKLGDSAIFNIAFEDGSVKQVYIKEVQRHSLKRNILHVSLQTLKAGQKVTVAVPVTLENTDDIKVGILEQALYEVEVETLPSKVPNEYTLDAGKLEIGDTLTVADLESIPEVEILDEQDSLIATVSAPRTEEELEATDTSVEPDVISEAEE